MKELNMPEELIRKAKTIMLTSEGIKQLLRGLLDESVRNQRDWQDLWKQVDDEAKKQGIERDKDDMINFDPVQCKFMIIKR